MILQFMSNRYRTFCIIFHLYVYQVTTFSKYNRARKSRTTLQNKVRLKVLPEQLTLFVTRLWHSKIASFNSFLLYRPDYCSEIHALSYSSNEKYR